MRWQLADRFAADEPAHARTAPEGHAQALTDEQWSVDADRREVVENAHHRGCDRNLKNLLDFKHATDIHRSFCCAAFIHRSCG